MHENFYNLVARLKSESIPFVTATVVRSQAPSSGKAGDKAVITRDGTVTGWVGGGCVQGIVLNEAKAAMRDGKPRLVRVSPEPVENPESGIISYKMTCHSGGTIDVYIEPQLPNPQLIIIGKSIIGRSLIKVARALDYNISLLAQEATRDQFPQVDQVVPEINLESINVGPNTYIVVATQGDQDEKCIRAAIDSEASYVAFIASRRKRDGVYLSLLSKGVEQKKLDAIKSPAGLDINAKTSDEVAISILAEIIQTHHGHSIDFSKLESENSDIYINPVCGIEVSKTKALHILEHKEEKVYFCCDGCKILFEKDPDKYFGKTPEVIGMPEI